MERRTRDMERRMWDLERRAWDMERRMQDMEGRMQDMRWRVSSAGTWCGVGGRGQGYGLHQGSRETWER